MEYLRVCFVAALLLGLAGCAGMPMGSAQRVYSEAPRQSARPQQAGKSAPQVAYRTQAGETDPKIKPYSVMGKTYWPVQSGLGFREEGFASWYGIDFHGKKTATGEVYDMFSISAAHKTLPLGTKVRVTNLENGRELELVVNDRGPFVDGRIIDLSYASARLLGMADSGLARVRVEGIEENPVLARANGQPVALASAETAARRKSKVVEKDLSDSSATQNRPRRNEAPAVAAARPQHQAAQQAMASSDGGRYSVQVGAFSQDENARRVKDRLVQSGFRQANVVRAVRGGRELSVVQAGSFEAREQAEEVLRAVQGEFPASFISSGA